MNDTFMKTRPVFPLLLSMALPNVISMLVNSLYNIVDSLFVAQISEQAMTALSLVFPIQNFVNAVAIGFGIGINAQIALYLGAGDHENANRAATHGMMFSLLHGVLGMVLCIAIMPGFLRRFTTDPALVDMGVTYSTIVFLFSLVNMADLAFEKIFQSVGRMNVAMVALITGCVTNIALDPVLIFGLGPVPALGIAGAALATGIGQAVSLVVYLYVYCTTEVAVRFSRRCLRFDAALDGKLYAIGVPAILNLALPSLLVTFLNGLLAVYSQSYVTVLGIYYKLQTFLYLPANGIVQGMRPLVGYNYGAREHGRVSRLYNLTLGLSAGIMAIGTLLCLTIAGPLMGLFTSNPETIAIGQTALRVICLGFIVSAVSTTSSGALEGLGKGVPSLVISLCRLYHLHHAHCVGAVRPHGPYRCLARLLDHRGPLCRDCLRGISQGSPSEITLSNKNSRSMEREFFVIISSFVEGCSQIRPRVLSSLATPSSVTAGQMRSQSFFRLSEPLAMQTLMPTTSVICRSLSLSPKPMVSASEHPSSSQMALMPVPLLNLRLMSSPLTMADGLSPSRDSQKMN